MTFRGRKVGIHKFNDNPRCNLAEKYYIIRQSEKRSTSERLARALTCQCQWVTSTAGVQSMKVKRSRSAPGRGPGAPRPKKGPELPTGRCGVAMGVSVFMRWSVISDHRPPHEHRDPHGLPTTNPALWPQLPKYSSMSGDHRDLAMRSK